MDVYGQAILPLATALDLTVGLRRAQVENEVEDGFTFVQPTEFSDRRTAGQAGLSWRARDQLRLFLRYDTFDRFVSALVYVPRDRYSTGVRERIGEHLAESFGGYIAAYYPQFRDAPLARRWRRRLLPRPNATMPALVYSTKFLSETPPTAAMERIPVRRQGSARRSERVCRHRVS